MTASEASERLQRALDKIYGKKVNITSQELLDQVKKLTPIHEVTLPEWLSAIPTTEEDLLSDEDRAAGVVGYVDECLVTEYLVQDEEDWMSTLLLDGGLE
jgi:hypothetical protein